MKRFRILSLAFALLTFATAAALAQTNNSITWKMLTPTLKGKPGEVVNVKLQATLVPKEHLYSTKTAGASPTEFTVGEKGVFALNGGGRADRKPIRGYDENFEDTTEFWEKGVTFTVPVKIAKSAKPGKTDGWVNVNFMTCNDARCIPPTDVKLSFAVEVAEDTTNTADTATTPPVAAVDTAAKADTAAVPATTDTAAVAQATPSTGDSGATTGTPQEGSSVAAKETDEQEGLLGYLIRAFLAGLGSLLTPCVYPMIPITVSFFTKRTQTTRRRSVRDATVYALGIILTFTGLGFLVSLIFGVTGVNDIATNPVVNIMIAGIFLALALSLFGMFEIQIPTSVLNRLNRTANEQGNSIGGILLMGLVFTLTSFTCTVPFVGSVLFGVTQGEWLWPLMGMAAFSFAFSIPFFLLALFPALMKSLPKSGGWLNSVKVVMGFLELAFAFKFLSNVDLYYSSGILTREVFLALWVAIAIITTMYLLGRFQLPHDSPVEKVGPMRAVVAVGFLTVGLWFGTGLFGGRLGDIDAFIPPQEYPGKGNTSLLAIVTEEMANTLPASGSSAAAGGNAHEAAGIKWIEDDFDQAVKVSRQTGKPIFVDFTGIFCTNCRWMEKNMFPRQDVKTLMSNYVLVQLYTDRKDSASKRNREMLIGRFKTFALPFYALITPDDKVLATMGVDSRPAPEEFIGFLKKGLVGKEGIAQK